ncbi:MAG: tetratricopeptide repeat protein, partial [Bacteroidales bacterium]|nr:tetratricopeptide repeat protein [Bacteroidales bacterium]
MKRILFHIVLSTLLFSHLYAQDARIDSLLALSKVATGNELARICFELSLDLRENQIDSALHFAHQAELLFSKSDPETLLPYVYKNKGSIYELKLVYDRSLSYYNRAYEEFIKLDNLQEIGICARNIGNIHYELADYGEACYFYLQSLNAYEKDGDRMGIAEMENNLGTVSHEMLKLDDAEKHYMNAYEIYREYESVHDECKSLNNIGLILYDKQQYDSALYYFREVLVKMDPDSLESEEEQYTLSAVFNNMALVNIDQDEFQMALSNLQQGLALARRIDDQYTIGSVYTNLGSLYGEMKRQDSALFFLHR